MKTITPPEKNSYSDRKTCPKCRAVLEFTNTDVKFHGYDEGLPEYVIICPHCINKIFIDRTKFEQSFTRYEIETMHNKQRRQK